MRLRRISLLWKIWLSTSVALTALFAVTGWMVQNHALESTARSLEEEAQTSFRAYESLWRGRAGNLRTVASIISSLPNVRAAFGTRDQATIRDAAQELWVKISDELRETAFFLVTDPDGNLIASLGQPSQARFPPLWPVVRQARGRFPEQVSGVIVTGQGLVQLVITPVYVDTQRGPALINVLLTGYTVNHLVAQRFKEETGGSEFLFLSPNRVFASTLNPRATEALIPAAVSTGGDARVSDGVNEYVMLRRELIDLEGRPVANLCIFRSFESVRQRIAGLRRNVIAVWLLAVCAGLALTWALARRIVEPVKKLDKAASEVARQNYDYRVSVGSEDELGRLAATFNSMCESLQAARRELIRQERISTIGRLAGSIVHDLRNPLAAIYGGAEMLIDADLSPQQVKRLAVSLYRGSRRIQELLQGLVNVTRGRTAPAENCRLREVVDAAVESVQPAARAQSVRIDVSIPEGIELPLERARVERVFFNLLSNAVEAMPEGGAIRVTCNPGKDDVVVEVADTGPGISPRIRDQLFQPFVTHGKKGGLGLGLALARQTILDHGGDLWVDSEPGQGARFRIRLPLVRPDTAGVSSTAASRP